METVILLSRKTLDAVININLDMSELDLTSAESKATYAEIKKYVLDKFGLKVSQLYIAQVKREFGLIERINYNVGEGKNHVPQVTPEKREAIIDALKHCQMIEYKSYTTKIDLLSGRSFFMQKFIGGSTAQVNQKLIFTKRCNSKH